HAFANRLTDAAGQAGWTRVLDLGSGTGSNLRYLAPRWPWVRTWSLLDHDAGLLATAQAASVPDPVRLVGDLASEGLAAISEADVVTASALLDLVSETWLSAAVRACASQGAAALFVLSYDGSIAWRDPDEDDGLVRDALNAHQQREKGLGQALGPDAAPRAEQFFRAAGYSTSLDPSPWRLSGPGDRALTLSLMRGWIDAAIELQPEKTERLRAWEARRTESVQADRYEVVVGHHDLLALPPGTEA
ncbi:MAG: class I SAM-dependent methyltransferase, partial [Longimicrobiales bacterium]